MTHTYSTCAAPNGRVRCTAASLRRGLLGGGDVDHIMVLSYLAAELAKRGGRPPNNNQAFAMMGILLFAQIGKETPSQPRRRRRRRVVSASTGRGYSRVDTAVVRVVVGHPRARRRSSRRSDPARGASDRRLLETDREGEETGEHISRVNVLHAACVITYARRSVYAPRRRLLVGRVDTLTRVRASDAVSDSTLGMGGEAERAAGAAGVAARGCPTRGGRGGWDRRGASGVGTLRDEESGSTADRGRRERGAGRDGHGAAAATTQVQRRLPRLVGGGGK